MDDIYVTSEETDCATFGASWEPEYYEDKEG